MHTSSIPPTGSPPGAPSSTPGVTTTSTPLGLRDAAALLTQAGYRISHSTISRQIRSGKIPNRGDARSPKVLVGEVIEAREANVNAAMRRQPAQPAARESAAPLPDEANRPGQPPSLNSARTESEQIKAQLLKLKLEAKQGGLLDRNQVADAMFTVMALLRETLTSRADLIASQIAGLSDAAEIRAAIDKHDRETLENMQAEFARMAQAALVEDIGDV